MATHHMKRTSARGFTLVELVITLAIASILTGTAVASFSSLVAASTLTSSVNTFIAHVQLARSESITYGGTVVMCPSNNQSHCTGGLQWHAGFILFRDLNQNSRREANEDLVRVFQAQNNSIEILSTPGRKKLKFRATGMSPGSNATIRICHSKSSGDSKAVIISNSGRPRVSEKTKSGASYSC